MQPEDAKLVTLARAARARAQSPTGAALRDVDGRTYAAGAVALPTLALSPIAVCVAMALTGGSRGAEAIVQMGEEITEADLALVAEFAGSEVPVHLVSISGAVMRSRTS